MLMSVGIKKLTLESRKCGIFGSKPFIRGVTHVPIINKGKTIRLNPATKSRANPLYLSVERVSRPSQILSMTRATILKRVEPDQSKRSKAVVVIEPRFWTTFE
jgi:deoxyinosine 3'endonuclease (endonuclease V)